MRSAFYSETYIQFNNIFRKLWGVPASVDKLTDYFKLNPFAALCYDSYIKRGLSSSVFVRQAQIRSIVSEKLGEFEQNVSYASYNAVPGARKTHDLAETEVRVSVVEPVPTIIQLFLHDYKLLLMDNGIDLTLKNSEAFNNKLILSDHSIFTITRFALGSFVLEYPEYIGYFSKLSRTYAAYSFKDVNKAKEFGNILKEKTSFMGLMLDTSVRKYTELRRGGVPVGYYYKRLLEPGDHYGLENVYDINYGWALNTLLNQHL